MLFRLANSTNRAILCQYLPGDTLPLKSLDVGYLKFIIFTLMFCMASFRHPHHSAGKTYGIQTIFVIHARPDSTDPDSMLGIIYR